MYWVEEMVFYEQWASARNSQWHHSGAEQRRAGRRWNGPSGDETARLNCYEGRQRERGRGSHAQKSTALLSVLKCEKLYRAWCQMSYTCLKMSAFAAPSGWSGVTDKTMITLVLGKPHKYMFPLLFAIFCMYVQYDGQTCLLCTDYTPWKLFEMRAN